MSTYRVVNPATGETEKEYPTATDGELREALTLADEAQRAWADRAPAERAAVLRRVADLYEERKDQLAAVITREMGKPVKQALGELAIVVSIYRYYAERGEGFLEAEELDVASGGRAVIRKEAVGPAGDHAVELPVLPGGPVRRAQPDAGQRHRAQARPAVPGVGAGDGAAVP